LYNNIKFQIKKRLLGLASLAEVASEVIELCHSENTEGTKAYYLPNQLDKVLHTSPESNTEQELFRISERKREHASTLAYKIKNSTILHNAVYKDNYRCKYPTRKGKVIGQKIETDTPLSMVSSFSGVQYFGHWLSDDVTTYILAEKFGTPVCKPNNAWSDKVVYADAFRQNWENFAHGHVPELIIFQDYSQNTLKVERYKKLRKNLRDVYTPLYADQLVYIKRGHGGNNVRIVKNENEIISALQTKGFKIIDLEKMNINKVIPALLNARLVVTVEGSHASHALYTLADNGNILLLMPPSIFTNVHKGWAEALNISYGFVVGDSISDEAFSINIKELLLTIDLML